MVTLRVEHLISFVICISGIFCNIISLIYFVKRESVGLINRLFILLNSFDLAVCLSGTLTMICTTGDLHSNPPYLIFKTLFSGSIQGTGLATVLISVCRAIMICRPFDHNIRGCRMSVVTIMMYVVGFGVEISDAVVNETCTSETFDKFRDYKRSYYIICLLVTVPIILTANILTMTVLKKTRKESDNDFMSIRPTVTILILSTIFCFISVLVLVHLVLLVARVKDDNFTIFFFFYGVPLNSALNPLVYITRNKEMQLFIRSLFCSCRSNELRQSRMRQITQMNLNVHGIARDQYHSSQTYWLESRH